MSEPPETDSWQALSPRERYERFRAQNDAWRRRLEEEVDELERLAADEEVQARRRPLRIVGEELLAIVRAGLALPQRRRG